MHFLAAVLLAVISLSASCYGKIYTKCELAKELKCIYGFAQSSLGDWVCLVQHESSFNTAAVGQNKGSKDYGLFQINDYYWCNSGTGTNDCNINCDKLKDNDIADDVKCAKKIFGRHGFNAWYGWKNNCKGKNLSSYTSGCNLSC
ncbi:lysozyme c-1-like [Hyalella azteca]|uniref:lysozyme n=1 Tax=Hyalella azteca TaxID=294128 RepID=A0A8B7NLW0_HYAAZ|nr:lysozyme c-1-like [Hyalella azteca]